MNILDKFTENGYTLKEMKMVRETKKMMGDESIEGTDSVRIPVVNGIRNPCTLNSRRTMIWK
ncbi:aspartate-semialdehyde dehydrogenase domain protein [Paenibacillus sp. HGF5]|nr:aspartate-semialdehyde dehydrogenase domain protein [Paenibacillus sp. HGF5]